MTLTIIGIVVALVVVMFVWGIVRIRSGYKKVIELGELIKKDDIPELLDEFHATFKEKFNIDIGALSADESARVLSEKMDDNASIKDAFDDGDFYWYGAIPVGAYLGDYLTRHADARWEEDDQGVLSVVIGEGDNSATTYPFHKVAKHWTGGATGDIYAYLITASHILENMVEQGGASDR